MPATARTLAVYSEGSRLALVQAGQIVLTDLGDEAPDIVTIDPNSVVSRLAIADSLWLAVSKSTGGNLVLVDGLTGTSYDFAALAEQASPRFYVETLRFDASRQAVRGRRCHHVPDGRRRHHRRSARRDVLRRPAAGARRPSTS